MDAWAREMTEALDALLAEQPCFSLASLAVKGSDLIAAGMRPGRELGDALQHLLDAVMDGRVPNEKKALLDILPNLCHDLTTKETSHEEEPH